MCLICLELEKLTFIEAVRNFKEMAPSMDMEHRKEVYSKLVTEKELELLNKDEHMDLLRELMSICFDQGL